MRHGRIPALHFLRQKDSSASQQHSSAAPGKFQRPIILRESGFPRDTEGFRRCIFCGKKIPAHHSNIPAPHLEISSGPLFCGNEDSCETRKDSRAAFFAAKRFQRITATFQRRAWKFPAAHYVAGMRIPAERTAVGAGAKPWKCNTIF